MNFTGFEMPPGTIPYGGTPPDGEQASGSMPHGGTPPFPPLHQTNPFQPKEVSFKSFLKKVAKGFFSSVNQALNEETQFPIGLARPLNVRRYPIGFYKPAVPAGSVVCAIAVPQVIFRPGVLFIPAEVNGSKIADHFAIVDIRIGKNSQLVTAEEILANSFSTYGKENSITFDTANIGHELTIIVRNLDPNNAHDFRATMFGSSVD